MLCLCEWERREYLRATSSSSEPAAIKLLFKLSYSGSIFEIHLGALISQRRAY